MKKIWAIFFIFILSSGFVQPFLTVNAAPDNSGSKTIIMKIGSPTMIVNGEVRTIDAEGTVPVKVNGSTLVPMRTIFETLSAEVKWDGLTMAPLRFVAESLGAAVEWIGATQTIIITQSAAKFIKLGSVTVCIGDTLSQVESTLGKADRIDPSNYDFDWHVYNSDYSSFIMIGIKNNIVEALYSNSKGFATNAVRYGDKTAVNEKGTTFYNDRYDGGIIYACLIISDDVTEKAYGEKFYRAQELENFDVTNAFRVNHGLNVLMYDDIAALTARKHSQDMADKNFFNHINLDGLSSWDRYEKNGGKNFGSGENISSGWLLGIDNFDALVNSEGHRSNMLKAHKYLGTGYGYNAASIYKYYMTQFFSS